MLVLETTFHDVAIVTRILSPSHGNQISCIIEIMLFYALYCIVVKFRDLLIRTYSFGLCFRKSVL